MPHRELQRKQDSEPFYDEEPSVGVSAPNEELLQEQLSGAIHSQSRRDQIREWVGLRKVAMQRAAELRARQHTELKIQDVITAVAAPHFILEKHARETRIQEQEELREAGWREARNYLLVDGVYYRLLEEDELRGLEELPESFFLTYGIPPNNKGLSLYAFMFGGRESGGGLYPRKKLATEEMIMELAHALYSDVDFDHARIVQDYDRGSGYNHYFLSIYKSVDPVKISD